MLYSNEIKKCKTCGNEIAFVPGKDGKWYPVSVDRSTGVPLIAGKERHVCPYTREQILAIIAELEGRLAEEEEKIAAGGEWFDGRHGTRLAIQAWKNKLERAK